MKRLFVCLLLVTLLTKANAQNYDEAKVPAYTLPDVLKTQAGKKVGDRKAWEQVRRPELLKLFEDNIYGQMPTAFDSIRYHKVSEEKAMDGKAVLKQVEISVFRNKKSVQIHLVLFVPSQVKPAPVFLLINNRGKDNTDPTRVKKSEFWPAEMLIENGYAAAAFHVSDLAPDNKDTYATALLQNLYPEQLEIDNGMKAIGAWAWGASRVMDYFGTDRAINAKKVIVVGHSRGGKTSLWAAAQDKRFAACVSNCSGNTGAALARRQYGERISRINTTFPYWFNNNYKKFNDRENDLPVDQHMLIALVAPRPVYVTNASKDLWADPKGTFLALKAAEPVYSLYKIKSGLPQDPPGIDMPVIGSHFGYHNREGEHNMTAYDWANFIRFANGF